MTKTDLGFANLPFVPEEWRDKLDAQLVGMIVAFIGALVLVSLWIVGENHWLVRMTGWTAPLFAVSLVIIGLVLAAGDRAGYWSAEALVGAELLLLSLQAGTFAWQNASFNWLPVTDGTMGGLIGWVLGGMLVAWFGQGVAFLLVFLVGITGLVTLIRYTPLIYVAVYCIRLAPHLSAAVEEVRALRRTDHERLSYDGARSIYSHNFVAPGPVDMEEDDEYDRGARGRPNVSRSQVSNRAGKRAGRGRRRVPADSLPPMDLLDADAGVYGSVDVRGTERMIEDTLADFNVPVRVIHVESGPTVTQFGVEPQYLERSGKRRKVRVNRIVSLADDLALALAAPSVRIEAPVPGRPYVGIEVPNTTASVVSLRGILDSSAMKQAEGSLMLGLGRDTAGAPVLMDLARAPHLLIAGATGAGKSVCINAIIVSLLMQHGPESLRFVMVDPKMVELPGYNGIPHLISKVITDVEQVMGALTWLLLEMDDRYRTFRELGVRNIDSYNALARRRKSLEPLPYTVLIIDELADLMMTAAEDVERQICRLAQMARATGIHLILATQRPSTDVVTGLIKANFPSRIAFAVSSQVDSRVILDSPGAERLLGRGDMLLMRSDSSKIHRLQGCWVSDDEISRVTSAWKERADDTGNSVVAPWNSLLDRMDEEDELLQDAIDVLRDMTNCSTSKLQRKLHIGYPKAARVMEELEARGVVGPDMGGGQGREVLLSQDDDEDDSEYELDEEMAF